MTSFGTASSTLTSLLPTANVNTSLTLAHSTPKMAETLERTKNAPTQAATTTETTNNPITEFMQATTTPASSNAAAKATTNTTTKIPHPHPHTYTTAHPLSVLLQAKSHNNPFRRSASLRVRGTKSNLLFDIFNNEHNLHTAEDVCGTNVNTTRARIGQCDNSTPVVTKLTPMPPTAQESQRVAAVEPCSAAGRFSTRRKVVLNSQTSASAGLTRSLSLRRTHLYNSGCKTDAQKEACRALGAGATALPDQQTHDVTTPREQHSAAGSNGGTASGPIVQAVGEVVNGAETKRSAKDIQKMSLNLNGTSSTSPSATRVTPTGNGSSSLPKSKVSTPRTPTTTPEQQQQQQQQQQQHQQQTQLHNHHAHTTRYIKSSPTGATVPETKLTPKTPPVTPDSPCTYLDDDLDSMYSFATTTSGRSTMSCEHPYVARNGTTFSGRKMKYVVHCSNYAGQVGPDYLTPTQRATRQIRRLKELLTLARQDLEQKDSEILRLTREVVELRLFKASLSSPEERSASSDAVTVREAELKTSQDVSPIVDMVDDATKSSPRHLAHSAHHHHQLHHSQQLSSEMQSSFADSGHFEDMTTSSVHSKDSYAVHTQDIACGSDEAGAAARAADDAAVDEERIKSYELQRQELIRMYELKIEELIRTQDASTSEMKRSHNDKVEALLQKLAECNTRYADIVPDYEHAKERIRELEKQLEDLQRKLAEHEEKQNKMYLHMYQKGQEAERIARADQALELAHRAPNNKVSINELLHQLQNTQDELENIRAAECRNECGSNHALLTAKEAISLWVLGARKTIYRRLLEAQKNRTHVDPEVTLQFLKSAIYYFLTDKENSQGHLQAIESILEFTEAEKQNINKARSPK